MDVLRKELEQIYSSQHLEDESLDVAIVEMCKRKAESVASVTDACLVVTDAARDFCYLYAGGIAPLLDIGNETFTYKEISSSDEDLIYNRLHPEDLVEKRMLEYEYFKFVNSMSAVEKIRYKAMCRIRIKDKDGKYVVLDNSTQILQPSPNGKIWLILCTYDLSPDQNINGSINAYIKNNRSGEIISLSFDEKKDKLLTTREKEILSLVREGKLSKEIAAILGISKNTVDRHRQNILEKLCVGNSFEAVIAATSMGLLAEKHG